MGSGRQTSCDNQSPGDPPQPGLSCVSTTVPWSAKRPGHFAPVIAGTLSPSRRRVRTPGSGPGAFVGTCDERARSCTVGSRNDRPLTIRCHRVRLLHIGARSPRRGTARSSAERRATCSAGVSAVAHVPDTAERKRRGQLRSRRTGRSLARTGAASHPPKTRHALAHDFGSSALSIQRACPLGHAPHERSSSRTVDDHAWTRRPDAHDLRRARRRARPPTPSGAGRSSAKHVRRVSAYVALRARRATRAAAASAMQRQY